MQPLESVAHAGALGKLELDLVRARALPKPGEQSDLNAHRLRRLENRRVPLAARTWIAFARARRRLRPPSMAALRGELVRRLAPGGTFADIGCMWSVDGEIAFLAEEAGATGVTGLDLMPASARFRAEHARRGSVVRFVQGDLHDESAMGEVGVHDVVWCSGVLYHAPHPVLTLGRLRSITGSRLILSTETIPEVPGIAQACVFLPALPDADRRAHASARPGLDAAGLTRPFDASEAYGTWWWGLSRSAVRGMLTATGFEVLEEHGDGLYAVFVAQPSD
jgi:2-polyprenyl-3-methyl-5-hydroxy-6-metoxy-1,4-benzoquinol methylase